MRVAGARVSVPLYLTEHVRSLSTFGCLMLGQPWLSIAPRGNGQPVIVMPGLAAGDFSTAPLRGYLRGLGYNADGWGLGVNVGPTRKVLSSLRPMVEDLAQSSGQPVALVGWSLGGVFARLVARQVPDSVSQVIAMGSPFRYRYREPARGFDVINQLLGLHAPRTEWPEEERSLPPLPVPATSIYSRLDGIVDWRTCIAPVDDRHENVRVCASHLGMGHDPSVMWVVADRLGLPAGTWAPFSPPWYARLYYPSVHDVPRRAPAAAAA